MKPIRAQGSFIFRFLLISLVSSFASLAHAVSELPNSGQPGTAGQFIARSATIQGFHMPYVVYVPPGYTPAHPWPAILALHGSGESGTNNTAQTYVGMGLAVRNHPELYPAVVILPQCPSGRTWEDPGSEQAGAPRASLFALEAMVETMKTLNIDSTRLYLTGNSIGGFAAWNMAYENPTLFVAVMPISGGGNPQEMAPPLKNLPIWVFHGRLDPVIPVNDSRAMVEAIYAEGSKKIWYTEYPFGLHNVWDAAYANPRVATWLFSQVRGQ